MTRVQSTKPSEPGSAPGTTRQTSPSSEGIDGITIEAIPGLGPIRARALKKAGFSTVALLKAASPAELRSVPGMTEVKASQLSAYLRGEASRVGAEVVERTATPKPLRPRAPRAKPSPAARKSTPRAAALPPALIPPPPVPVAPTPGPFGDAPLVGGIRRVSAAVEELLRGADASAFGRGFARQLGKIASLAERIGHDSDTVKDAERVAGQLHKIELVLQEISAAGTLSSKRQDRFEEALRERRHKLQDAVDAAGETHEEQPAPTPSNRKDRTEKSDKKSRR